MHPSGNSLKLLSHGSLLGPLRLNQILLYPLVLSPHHTAQLECVINGLALIVQGFCLVCLPLHYQLDVQISVLHIVGGLLNE